MGDTSMTEDYAVPRFTAAAQALVADLTIGA
jgi:hypothetical protein